MNQTYELVFKKDKWEKQDGVFVQTVAVEIKCDSSCGFICSLLPPDNADNMSKLRELWSSVSFSIDNKESITCNVGACPSMDMKVQLTVFEN